MNSHKRVETERCPCSMDGLASVHLCANRIEGWCVIATEDTRNFINEIVLEPRYSLGASPTWQFHMGFVIH